MRFALLVVAGAGIGALAAFAIPTSAIQSASSTIQDYGTAAGRTPHDLADLNPIRMAYDVVVQRIREGNTPEQLGFKSSPLTFKPVVMPTSSFDFSQNRYSYAQNPAGWHGTPPH
jgi:hypothetical protein